MVELDPRTTALVVIDMQNDFCEPDGYYAGVGRAVEPIRRAIEPITRMLTAFRKTESTVVFTRLVYDERLPTVEERHSVVPARWAASERRLVPGSWGSSLVVDLEPRANEFVVDKSGYSGFHGTDLDALLRRRGIRTVVLAGTVSYACVLSTALDAFDRDYDVVVASDGVSAWFEHLQQAALEIVELLVGHSMSSDQIGAALRGEQVKREVSK